MTPKEIFLLCLVFLLASAIIITYVNQYYDNKIEEVTKNITSQSYNKGVYDVVSANTNGNINYFDAQGQLQMETINNICRGLK